MPKKPVPSPVEMRQWLDWLENGLSETAIAKKAGREIRTVKKYLAIAADERRANIAQLDLIKEALKTHQGQLIDTLDKLSNNAEVISPHAFELPWPFDNDCALQFPGGSAVFSYGENRIEVDLTLDFEKSLELELIKEHLPKDSLWGEHKKWQNALGFYFQALATFKEKAASILMQNTGGIFVDENLHEVKSLKENTNNNDDIKLVVANALNVSYHKSLNTILNCSYTPISERVNENLNYKELMKNDKKFEANDRSELVRRMTVYEERGEVLWGPSNTIAFCRGRETECQDAIIRSIEELPKTPEAKRVRNTYQNLITIAENFQRTIQEIKLGIIIMGECRVCKRLKG